MDSDRWLTASTLSSEVFPAFCNPIIVTSISVALKSYVISHDSLDVIQHKTAHKSRLLEDRITGTFPTYQNNLISQSYTLFRKPAIPFKQ